MDAIEKRAMEVLERLVALYVTDSARLPLPEELKDTLCQWYPMSKDEAGEVTYAIFCKKPDDMADMGYFPNRVLTLEQNQQLEEALGVASPKVDTPYTPCDFGILFHQNGQTSLSGVFGNPEYEFMILQYIGMNMEQLSWTGIRLLRMKITRNFLMA
ncbi:hypothetical protein C4573_07320 [Candidatus Woesearchaeota archaeon]|nr:MAG: hypothetical protein C4573_07320 [Candidatus Woesearchaeota archaeon]